MKKCARCGVRITPVYVECKNCREPVIPYCVDCYREMGKPDVADIWCTTCLDAEDDYLAKRSK